MADTVQCAGWQQRNPRDAPVLRRERLHHALDRAMDVGFALVVSPIGTGKTTLLEDWVAHRELRVRWVRGSAPHEVGWLSQPPQSANPPEGRRVLVLDDAQAIDTVELLAVQRYIERATPRVGVVVVSRTLPAFNLARREMPMPVLLTEDDLRFRPWEIATLFADVYQMPISQAAALDLTTRTDGWAAALQFHRLGRDAGHVAPVPNPAAPNRRGASRTWAGQGTAGGDRLLGGYVDREVLDRLPSALVRFLTATSVFDTVTVDRANALLGTGTAGETLRALSHREGLIRADPADGCAYHYHPVLRAHLRSRLTSELGHRPVRELFDRAATIVGDTDDVVEEAVARARAGNWAALSRLLRRHGSLLTNPAGSGWLDALPVGLSNDDPWAGLALARRQLSSGQLEAAARTASHAWDAFEAGSSGDESAAEGAAEGAALCAEVVDAGVERMINRLEDSRLVTAAVSVLVDAEDATSRLDDLFVDARATGQVWLARAVLAIALSREPREWTLTTVRQAALARDAAGDEVGAFLLECAVAVGSLRVGSPDVDLLDRLVDRARHLRWAAAEAWLRAGLALTGACLDLPEAVVSAQTAAAVARSAGSDGALATAYAALAILRPESRADLLAQAERLTEPTTGGHRPMRPWTWLAADLLEVEAPPQNPGPRTGAARTTGRESVGRAGDLASLDVRCFGDLRIRLGAAELDLTRVRPVVRAVLSALIVRAGRPVHRDELIEWFWPARTEEPSVHSLHVAISAARRAIETAAPGQSRAVLARRGESYAFAPGRGDVSDVQRFRTQLSLADAAGASHNAEAERAALTRAVELYAAHLLPHEGAVEWVVALRAELCLLAAGAATRLAVLHVEASDATAAITAASRAVELDPWNDAGWRALIAAHGMAGSPAAASLAQEGYQRMLRSLGVDSASHGPAGRPARRRPPTPQERL
ncbi:MAG: winged helix-turn-helix domain-containing protein [Intrasporangium sp.]|uniref:winged helix-turn-helix domain-containing protein n=1 Tax=Intrasporangium sp. TaxID=1925024 RepID=UPI002647B9F0|nr:winged helix-turn-helix domain-containing protein [Intrasporangium sp.]MDN5797667.1 winged helix-turn-helix domain-containing protein [Intrasporangium sp.]